MAKGKAAAEGAIELVGENVSVVCTDGNRITKETHLFGELQEQGELGVRIVASEHGSKVHYFIPYSNMVYMFKKERPEKDAKGGKGEEAEE